MAMASTNYSPNTVVTVPTGGLTAGAILFGGGGGTLSVDATKLVWDDTNNRLGVGDSTPDYTLHVVSADNTYVALTGNGGTFFLNSNSSQARAEVQTADTSRDAYFYANNTSNGAVFGCAPVGHGTYSNTAYVGASNSNPFLIVSDHLSSPVILARFNPTIADGETALLIRRNKGGVYSEKRVKEGADGTGPGGVGRGLYTDA